MGRHKKVEEVEEVLEVEVITTEQSNEVDNRIRIDREKESTFTS